jgi:putative ABC transport system permease protein
MSTATFEFANLKESFSMAIMAIRANKLRSALTLLGIVVGIFSIISVMTAMDVLRKSIEEGITRLGVNTFQIQKYPAFTHGGAERRKYRNRRDLTYDQALAVRARATLAEAVGVERWEWGRMIVWEREKTNPNVSIVGVNVDALITNDWPIERGRGFTGQDMDMARSVAILGSMVREKLFPPYIDPIGETIRIDRNLYEVVGLFENKQSALGGNQGNYVAIPVTTFFQKYGKTGRSINITVKAKDRDVFEDCIEQVRFILRAARKVPPGEEDDFSYFSNDSLITQFNEFTFYLRLGVLVVSSIALIAAGVGIMNIMLVSVTERTREIGIRKALGARKNDLLTQFLIEAIILCELGGLLGIVVGILGGNSVGLMLDIPAAIPWDWVVIGLTACSLVGIVFGVYPAWKASNLDPVEALRYE